MTDTTTTTTTTTPPWYEGKVSTEVLGFWQNKAYDLKDPVTVAVESGKAAFELQKHFGAPADQIIRMPKDAADAAGWKAVHQRLGVPAEAKEYDFANLKRAGDKDVEPWLADTLRNALHAANVPKDVAPRAYADILKGLDSADTAKAAADAAKLADEKTALAKEWGVNGEFNKLTAMQGARRLGVTPEDVQRFESVLGYQRTMEIFRKIGAATTEATFVSPPGPGGMPTTLAGAESRKAELMSDTAWRDRYLKGDAAAVREMAQLNSQIAGVAA